MALTLYAGGALDEFMIPFWVVIVCALTMGIGTAAGGWRITVRRGDRVITATIPG